MESVDSGKKIGWFCKLRMNEEKNIVNQFAPVAVFSYKRKDHLIKTIEALGENIYADQTDVYVFSDEGENEDDKRKVCEVREYLHSVSIFRSLTVIEREINYGLRKNIEDGVSRVVSEYGKIIVLEDDLVTSRFFLKYMNDALNKYNDNDAVMEISGYSVPAEHEKCEETAFLHFADCWGWATWKRAWEKYDRNPDALVKRFTLGDIYRFNLDGRANFWNQVLENKRGNLNTWAIFWQTTIYLNDGLMLYPTRSLVKNIGVDGSGDHKAESSVYDTDIYDQEITAFPDVIEEDKNVRRIVGDYFKSVDGISGRAWMKTLYYYFKYRILK